MRRIEIRLFRLNRYNVVSKQYDKTINRVNPRREQTETGFLSDQVPPSLVN
jgi:hypothetical protein